MIYNFKNKGWATVKTRVFLAVNSVDTGVFWQFSYGVDTSFVYRVDTLILAIKLLRQSGLIQDIRTGCLDP